MPPRDVAVSCDPSLPGDSSGNQLWVANPQLPSFCQAYKMAELSHHFWGLWLQFARDGALTHLEASLWLSVVLSIVLFTAYSGSYVLGSLPQADFRPMIAVSCAPSLSGDSSGCVSCTKLLDLS